MNLFESRMLPSTTSFRRLGKRAFVLVVLLIMLMDVIAMTALAAQSIHQNRVAGALSLPGQFISLERGNIYVNCQGDPQDPSIIFENGMGLSSENWDWVQRALSVDYHACVYDRAGTGFSGPSPGRMDAGHSADLLSDLLDELGVAGPIVIAGHSYGALIARVFADRFPDRVAGLVLIDSSHEDMAERLPEDMQQGFNDMLKGFSALSIANQFGAAPVLGTLDIFAGGLEGGAMARATHLYGSTTHMAGSAAEAVEWGNSAILARGVAVRRLGDLPLSVVMVDGWPEAMMPSWMSMQEDLAALSSKGRLTVIEGADHFGVLTDETFASQVTNTVFALARQAF